MKKILLFFSLLLLPLGVNADNGNLVVTCDNDKIKLNDQVICRVSANGEYSYNKISFKLNIDDKLSLVDIRSNYEKVWSIKNNNNVIEATSKSYQNGLQEFGIILLKGKSSGVSNIKLSNVKFHSENEDLELEDSETNIKVISADNYLSDIKINDKSLSGFDVDTLKYTYEVDKDTKKIKIEGISRNEFANVSGTGEFDLSLKNNEFIFPIKVISESGNSKIYVVRVVRKDFNTNNIDKTLKSIMLKDDSGNTLLFSFKSNVYDYNIDVKNNVTSLTISPTLNNEDVSFVKNYGKQTIKLSPGANLVLIKIKDSDGQIVTYSLNITKPLDNSSSDSYLKSLVIKDYKLDFSKKVKRYILNINSGTKKLDISAIANNDKASIKISGNDNLKEGSIIKIIVTAENETRTVYQITVHIVKKSIIPYIVSFIIVLALGYGGYNYYKNLKLKRKRELEIKLEQERLRLEEEKRRLEAEKKKNTKKKTTAKKGTIKKNSSSTKKKSSGTKTSVKKNVKKVSKKK